jgi:hypothetical protein
MKVSSNALLISPGDQAESSQAICMLCGLNAPKSLVSSRAGTCPAYTGCCNLELLEWSNSAARYGPTRHAATMTTAALGALQWKHCVQAQQAIQSVSRQGSLQASLLHQFVKRAELRGWHRKGVYRLLARQLLTHHRNKPSAQQR